MIASVRAAQNRVKQKAPEVTSLFWAKAPFGPLPLSEGRVRERCQLSHKHQFDYASKRLSCFEVYAWRLRCLSPLPHPLLGQGEGTRIILALRLTTVGRTGANWSTRRQTQLL